MTILSEGERGERGERGEKRGGKRGGREERGRERGEGGERGRGEGGEREGRGRGEGGEREGRGRGEGGEREGGEREGHTLLAIFSDQRLGNSPALSILSLSSASVHQFDAFSCLKMLTDEHKKNRKKMIKMNSQKGNTGKKVL